MGTRTHISLVVITWLYSGIACAANGATISNHGEGIDPDKIVLVEYDFSALCNPLAAMYDEFNHRKVRGYYDGATDLAVRNVEDAYRKDFRKIGLVQPDPLIDLTENKRRSVMRQQFYSLPLTKEGGTRAVFLGDYFYGGHGDFDTTVWILKRDTKLDSAAARSQSEAAVFRRAPPGISPTDVSVAVLLSYDSWPSEPYQVLLGPRPLCGRCRNVEIGGGAAITQHLFVFNGNVFFVARQGVTGWVYRFDDQLGIQGVCGFTSTETINSRNRGESGD